MAGELTVKRKVDKVIIILEPNNVVIATLEAEPAITLANSILAQADKILAATAK